jgi:hypothetical protein
MGRSELAWLRQESCELSSETNLRAGQAQSPAVVVSPGGWPSLAIRAVGFGWRWADASISIGVWITADLSRGGLVVESYQ